MKTRLLRILFAAIALMGLPASGLAVPVVWTLNGVTFNDGGTASGSFVHDADTNTYSAVNITTSTGSSVSGSTYGFVCASPCGGPQGYNPTFFAALSVPSSTSSLSALPLLELHSSSALTNGGGTVTLTSTSFEDRCLAANCASTQAPFRTLSAGSIVGVARRPIVYAVDITSLPDDPPGSLTGTITTDGTVGVLVPGNIIAWNLTGTSYSSKGPINIGSDSTAPDSGAACGDGGCPFATVDALAFPGTSTLELGMVAGTCLNYILLSATGAQPVIFFPPPCPQIIEQGFPGAIVSGPYVIGVVNNYQGLWWAAPAGVESGWGINFAHQGNTIFATWFTYDPTGKGLWLSMTAPQTTPGVYSGTLFSTTGPPFNVVPFDPNQVKRATVGTATLSFRDPNNAAFAYVLNGIAQTKNITRQVFGPLPVCATATTSLAAATNYADLWWAAPPGFESGWGVNLAQEGSTIFATWFTYDLDGTPMWLSATVPNTAPRVYAGTLYRTTGPAFNAVPFNPANVALAAVGKATFTFSDGNDATFAYTVNGISQTKAITRQVFASPGTVCQ